MDRDALIRGFSCGRCRAAAGSPCTGRGGRIRLSCHIQRWEGAGITQDDLRKRSFERNR